MASFKELSLSRPLPSPNQRAHAHSISLGAVNAHHRVTRRKSVTTAAANAAAALAASLKDSGEAASLPMGSHRRSLAGRKGLESSSVGTAPGYLSQSLHSPSQETPVARKSSPSQADEADAKLKNRNRRASEGAQLLKGDGKRSMADLRCDRCGKGYKHGSCLSKHMWEHDPAWAITSKLLISKHQQVQLLEAASVLVTMNVDEPSDDSAEAESVRSSATPDDSSQVRDGLSSAETTPPPLDEREEDDDFEMSGVPSQWTKRPSIGNLSAFSRSYQQSIPSSSYTGSAPLHSPAFSSHFRHSSIDTRPSTADTRLHEDDEADLAAAIGLCNFGTPRTGPVSMTPDVPPVPPLPARFLDSSSHPGNVRETVEPARRDSEANIFLPTSLNPSLSYKVSDEREVRPGSAAARESRHRRNADVDFGSRPAPADDDEDGVFGRMEE